MTIIDIAREDARQATGQFGEQHHSAPEAGLSISAALAGVAAHNIRTEAPIGAVTATVELDETTGTLVFFRYADRRGATLATDARPDLDDALAGASIDAFVSEVDVSERTESGERWFDLDLDD